MSLNGKNIIVTGASGDIGSTLTRSLLDQGAAVAAIDLSGEALQRLSRAAPSQNLLTLTVDVTSENALAAAFGEARRTLGSIDGIVCGAGIEGARSPLEFYPLDTFLAVMAVNVTGVFLGIKYGAPLLRPNGGSIVNIASSAGLKGAPGMAGYVASKHAVVGLTRVAALDYANQGIRVNAVCPSAVEGRMIEAIYASHDHSDAVAAESRRKANPSGRYAKASEVVALVEFLLSDSSTFINGSCYSIDGGVSAS